MPGELPSYPVENIQALPTGQVFQFLATGPGGLTQAEAAARLQRYGRNALQEIKGRPLYLKFLANFTHLMALLLWVGGIVAFVAQMPQLGIAIWMVNVINGVFSFWQEFKAEKATEALRELLPSYARVLRDGQEQRILAEEQKHAPLTRVIVTAIRESAGNFSQRCANSANYSHL